MAISRSSRPNKADLQPQVPPLSSPRFKHELFKHMDNTVVELNDIQKHKHRGIWSMSIAAAQRSPGIEMPDTVDEDPCPRSIPLRDKKLRVSRYGTGKMLL
jgi:hypothetical protein